MGIFKKIWHWLSQDVTKGFQKSDEEFMLKSTTYNTGGYTGGVKEVVGYSEASKIRREEKVRRTTMELLKHQQRQDLNLHLSIKNNTIDFKREADEYFRQQEARRKSGDNYLTGIMVGYLFTDSLNNNNNNNNNSHRNVEENKSSNYESGYTPSSSSSYDSGSYSSSSDSGSSSSSCDSGGC